MKKYNKKPDIISQRKEYNSTPERQAKGRECWAKPELKENNDKLLEMESKVKEKIHNLTCN